MPDKAIQCTTVRNQRPGHCDNNVEGVWPTWFKNLGRSWWNTSSRITRTTNPSRHAYYVSQMKIVISVWYYVLCHIKIKMGQHGISASIEKKLGDWFIEWYPVLRYHIEILGEFFTDHDLSGYAMRGFPIIKAKLERGSLVFLSHKYKITAGQDSNMEFCQHEDCNYCNNLAKTDSAPVINTVLSNQWEVHR